MEIEILTHSKTLKKILPEIAVFYAKRLNITKSKYKVFICTDPTLKEDGNNGLCAKTGPKEITIALYSRLTPVKLLYTLAHEMVHAKQMCRGHYKHEPMKYGEGVHHYWLGKRVVAKYIDRPWEREAFKLESILVEELTDYMNKKLKNKKVDKK